MAQLQRETNPYEAPRAECFASQAYGSVLLSKGWLGYLWAHAGFTILLVALVGMANRVPIVSALGNSVFTLAFVVALLAIPVAVCATIRLYVVGIVENPSRRNALVVEVLLLSVQLAAVGYFFS